MKNRTGETIAKTIAEECLAVRIRLLNRTITNIYDEALRPVGATVGQLNILVTVAKFGPISPGDVSRRLIMEKSTVSRNVERLRNLGWIRVLAGESGRTQLIELSAKGHRLLEKAVPYWKEAQERTISVLGQRGTQAVRRAADTVWAQLGQQ